MSTDVTPALRDALRAIAGVPRLLVALDFDGTLASEVDSPEDARAIPAAQAAVERLLALPETRLRARARKPAARDRCHPRDASGGLAWS